MKRKISSIVYAALVCSLLPWMGRSVQAASVSVSAIEEESDVISSDGSDIQEGSAIEREPEESLPPGPVIEDGPDGMPPTVSAIEEESDEMSPSGLAEGGVPIDEAHFPDAVFRGLLSASDKDRDGILSEQEIGDIKILDCDSDEGMVESLEGIGYLKNLEILLCSGNGLTSLDVSQNNKLEVLYCYDGRLESLVIGDMPHLVKLNCRDNRLTSLDLTGAPRLKRLDCKRNQLESLSLGSMEQMYLIDCRENAFTSLDLSSVASISEVDCRRNQSLTSLKCKKIQTLDCSECQLTSLELEEIRRLDCSKNQLAYLKASRVSRLYCSENVLAELDLSGSPMLEYLDCSNNQLRILDLTNNFQGKNFPKGLPFDTKVKCEHDRLESIKFGDDNRLYNLYCRDNQLTSLDTENMQHVDDLSCEDNRFDVLDVSGMPTLSHLSAGPGVKVTYTDTPRLVSLTRDKKEARLTWEYRDKSCDGFYVYRKKGNGGWEKIKKISDAGERYTGSCSYTDKKAGKGNVTYTVRAFRYISGTRIGGYDDRGLTAGSVPSTPKSLKASPGKGKIKITWNKVAKCSGYRIYRKTAKTKWKMIADVRAGKTLYIDKGAKKGRTYSYRVQAYKKGTGKDKNVTVKGGYSAIKKARL